LWLKKAYGPLETCLSEKFQADNDGRGRSEKTEGNYATEGLSGEWVQRTL